MTDNADTDPAVVAARAIDVYMGRALSLKCYAENEVAEVIRTAYAQRDKAWAELAEMAYREGERDRGAKDWGDVD